MKLVSYSELERKLNFVYFNSQLNSKRQQIQCILWIIVLRVRAQSSVSSTCMTVHRDRDKEIENGYGNGSSNTLLEKTVVAE